MTVSAGAGGAPFFAVDEGWGTDRVGKNIQSPTLISSPTLVMDEWRSLIRPPKRPNRDGMTSRPMVRRHRFRMIGRIVEPQLDEMLALATRLAEQAGEMAMREVGAPPVRIKADNSIVTHADLVIEEFILEAIAANYPDHSLCAEEATTRTASAADRVAARYCWVVDPIDGTRNFALGFPCFCTAIAVLDHGRPVVGVVREHNSGVTLSAVARGGVVRNGVVVERGDAPTKGDVLIGVPSSKDPFTQDVVRRFSETQGLVLRNLGSTAWQTALVGVGGVAGAFARRCKIWDVAAAALIVTEGGCVITGPHGESRERFDLSADTNDNVPVLAADPHRHKQLLALIKASTR